MPNQYLPGVIQIPSMLLITSMSQSYPMTVGFSVPETGANTYFPNQCVKLNVPRTWGMHQANGIVGKILSVNDVSMVLDVDSTHFDAFIDGSETSETPASLAPAGSRNLEFSNQTNRVPFQSLNNQGN